MPYEIGPYEPCPCRSGEKYKFCCAQKARSNRHGKYPIGTVARYGPDDKTTTKIAASVLIHEQADPLLKRWLGPDVPSDPKVEQEIRQFFAQHGVKTVTQIESNVGCPHEEGIDFPHGTNCPHCPFWAGKQGSHTTDSRWDALYNGVSGVSIEQPGQADDDDDDFPDEDFVDRSPEDLDASLARAEAIVADVTTMDKALENYLAHLQQNLKLPCILTGIEDFQWEEPYVFGGWSETEYQHLKKTQPSYHNRFELDRLDLNARSQWAMFFEDIKAHVKRISDGKRFILGLAELRTADRADPNYQLLDDYATWFINNR